MLYYYLNLPNHIQQKIISKVNLPIKKDLPGSDQETANRIRPLAAREIFENALVRMNNDCLPAAASEFQAALQMGMDSLQVYDKLAAINSSLEDWNTAERYIRHCVDLSGGDWRYLYNLGLALAFQGKMEEAAEIAVNLTLRGVDRRYLDRLRGLIGGK